MKMLLSYPKELLQKVPRVNLQRSEVSEALRVDRLGILKALQRMRSYKMRHFIKNGSPQPCRICMLSVLFSEHYPSMSRL